MKYYTVWDRKEPNGGIGELTATFEPCTVEEAQNAGLIPALRVRGGASTDLLVSPLGWPILSAKARAIIDAYRLVDDTFSWYDFTVDDSGTAVAYSALWFPVNRDPVNRTESTYVGRSSFLRRVVLSAEALNSASVAAINSEGTRWAVAEDLCKSLKANRCTGFTFEAVALDGPVSRPLRGIDITIPSEPSTAVPGSSGIPQLPADLQHFLEQRRKLRYNAKRSECGTVVLKDLGQLVTAQIGVVVSSGHDDISIPAISLTDECDGYDPEFLLLWLPKENLYGSWDSDHSLLLVFPQTTWTDIVANPLPYLNSQWEAQSSVAVPFDPTK